MIYYHLFGTKCPKQYGPIWIKVPVRIKTRPCYDWKPYLKRQLSFKCSQMNRYECLWNIATDYKNYFNIREINTYLTRELEDRVQEMFSMCLAAKIRDVPPSGQVTFIPVLFRPLGPSHVVRHPKAIFQIPNTIVLKSHVISFFNKNVK